MSFQNTHGKNLEQGMFQLLGEHAEENWGSGFLVEGGFIVTNCHCLPRLSDPMLIDSDHVFIKIKGLTSQEDAIAEVIYADPYGDMAILQSLDYEHSAEGADRYDELIEKMAPISINSEPLLRFSKIRVHVRNVDGFWISGEATVVGHGGRTLSVRMDKDNDRILGGTSGSPVFNEDGLAIGVIKIGDLDYPNFRALALPDYLPMWLLDRIMNGIVLPDMPIR